MLSDLPPQLIALAASLSYAASGISARRGLRYSTPITVTFVSLLVHAFGLGAVLLLSTGVPNVPPLVLLLFFITGTLQPVIRVFTYAGIFYMGASRGTTVRGCHPLFSTSLAIIFLGESANIWILAGTVLIVGGVALISWQPASERAAYRWWWHIGFPLGAALLAGISHPIRRYALGLANEPLFYAAMVGWVSLFWMLGYLSTPLARERPKWSKEALAPFLMAGIFETLGNSSGSYCVERRPGRDRVADRRHQPAVDSRRHRRLSPGHREAESPNRHRRALRGRGHHRDFTCAMNHARS